MRAHISVMFMLEQGDDTTLLSVDAFWENHRTKFYIIP